MSILITGATGFVGSHLLKTFLQQTKEEMVLLKRSFSNTRRIAQLLPNPRLVCYDIDKTPLQELPWENIEMVIHCATQYGRGQTSSCDVLESNLVFPIQLLELCVEHKVKTFINTDSFFNKPHFSYPYLLNYFLSKKSLSLWLEHFSKSVSIINLILEHAYGEDDNPDKFVQSMIDQIVIRKVPSIALSAGEQKRDFIYISDVCAAYLQAVDYARKHSFAFKTFYVGTGKETSIKEFVSLIQSHSPPPHTQLFFGALPYREKEIMSSRAQSPRLPDVCKYSVTKGIKKIIAYYTEK